VLDGDPSVRLDLQEAGTTRGIYGRYVPTAAVTIGQFLMLAEHVPAAARVSLNGQTFWPRRALSSTGFWKMQRRGRRGLPQSVDGEFRAFVSPELDDAALTLYTVGSADTGGECSGLCSGGSDLRRGPVVFPKSSPMPPRRAWHWLTDSSPTTIADDWKNRGLPDAGTTATRASGRQRSFLP